MLFFGLYCAILISQIHPEQIFALDESLRQRVVDESGQLQQVTVLEDFFTYLSNTIMPGVFPGQWYNNANFTTAESGYVLDYNKLVGGLLIVQERGLPTSPCRVPYFPHFRSAYEVKCLRMTRGIGPVIRNFLRVEHSNVARRAHQYPRYCAVDCPLAGILPAVLHVDARPGSRTGPEPHIQQRHQLPELGFAPPHPTPPLHLTPPPSASPSDTHPRRLARPDAHPRLASAIPPISAAAETPRASDSRTARTTQRARPELGRESGGGGGGGGGGGRCRGAPECRRRRTR